MKREALEDAMARCDRRSPQHFEEKRGRERAEAEQQELQTRQLGANESKRADGRGHRQEGGTRAAAREVEFVPQCSASDHSAFAAFFASGAMLAILTAR
jgi:hypothetical protein